MGMVALKCPQCGADVELDETREFGFCNYCGTKVMQDKVIVEHKGSVKVDNSNEVENLLQLARRAKESDNIENARNYYEKVLTANPNSWEAYFYSIYFASMSCKINEITLSANNVINCQKETLKLIKENLFEDEQKSAVNEIVTACSKLAVIFFNSANSHYNGISLSIRTNFSAEYINRAITSAQMCINLGDCIQEIFGEEYSDEFVKCWKDGITILKVDITVSIMCDSKKQIDIDAYNNKIAKYDDSYEVKETEITTPKSSKGGCYVATAVYGSYDCPQVWTLRRYRDNQLAKTWYGRLFIHTYYAISPTLVKWFGNTQWFKNMWKPQLDKMVKELQESGVESTPYEDKNW